MENLSNGDTITVKYKEDKVKPNSTEYVLTQTEKTYTVSGLEEYVTDINDIGEKDLEILKKNAVNFALSECENDFSVYKPGTFEVCAIYSMVKKDYSDQVSVFVVSFDYDSENGVKTGYFMTKYPKITKLPDGDYRINFNPGTYAR